LRVKGDLHQSNDLRRRQLKKANRYFGAIIIAETGLLVQHLDRICHRAPRDPAFFT
jgi:hypothetical protein